MRFLASFVILIFSLTHLHSSEAKPPFVVGGFYENYSGYRPSGQRTSFSISKIPSRLLTDLHYAFASINANDFSLQPTDPLDLSSLYQEMFKLKENSKNKLNIFLTVGGWNFNNPENEKGKETYKIFSEMVSNSENRQKFIASAVIYLNHYHFDGLDIDWEYPGDESRGGKEEDLENFVTFLEECAAIFKQHSLKLCYSAPSFVPQGFPKKYTEDPQKFYQWLARAAKYLDRINLMAYDYHGPFDRPKFTGVNAPLMRDTLSSSSLYVANAIDLYLKNGVPANKIVLGLPVFGHSYAQVSSLSEENSGAGKPFLDPGNPGPSTNQKGFLAYFEVADMITTKAMSFGVDVVTDTVYAFNSLNQNWVSFDNPDTLRLKTNLAKDKGLQGVILWAINLDEYEWHPQFPNLNACYEESKK